MIVGAGLAGLSAALDLAGAGWQVTVLERRPFAGGKTYSFTDPQTGAELDNGQHVFMRCCTEYIGFLRRIGGLGYTHIQPRLHVPVVRRGGARSALGAARLPAPLHLGPSFARYRHLTAREKVAVARLLLHLRRLPEDERLGLDGASFHDYLRGHGQPEAAIDHFWDLVVVPTLNGRAREVSAALAIFVFQRGFLAGAHDADLGLPARGLSHLHVEPTLHALASLGAEVRMRTPVRRVRVEGGWCSGVELEGGEQIAADAVVLAVPHTEVGALVPPALRERPPFAGLDRLGVSPILNLHAWYDRAVMDEPFVAYLDTPVQWIFNTSKTRGEDGTEGQHLAVTVSAAGDESALSKEELERLLLPEIEGLLPRARGARLLRSVVIKEPEATFAASPGSAALRPGPATPVPNLALAGAYTATGWPATMESAVRSGRAAARCLTGVASLARAMPLPAGS